VSTSGGRHPEVPKELRAKGLEIFGSAEKLAAFAAATSDPVSVTIGGESIRLVANANTSCGAKHLAELHKQNGLHGLDKLTGQDGVILDVGANIGDTAVMAAKRYPMAQVLAFEPVPWNYFHLAWNVLLNGVQLLNEDDLGKANKPGVLALDKAVSDGKDIVMRSQVGGNTCAAQADDMAANNSTDKYETTVVHSLRLPDFLASHGVKSVRYAKIDCEGCELVVVPMMESLISDKAMFENVHLEFHKSVEKQMSPAWRAQVEKMFEKRQEGCGKDVERILKEGTPPRSAEHETPDWTVTC